MTTNQVVKQVIFVSQDEPKTNQTFERLAMFNEDGTPFVALNFETGAGALLTGYEIATGAAALDPADTLNEALGKIEYRLDVVENAGYLAAAGVRSTVLTGFAVAGAVSAVADTDTILEALGKLQKAVEDLDTRVDALEV